MKSRGIIADLKKKVADFIKKITGLEKKVEQYEGKKESIMEQINYHNAQIRAPRRLAETIADIMRTPPERQEQQRTAPERKQSRGIDI